jgi:hypothetical protein
MDVGQASQGLVVIGGLRHFFQLCQWLTPPLIVALGPLTTTAIDYFA